MRNKKHGNAATAADNPTVKYAHVSVDGETYKLIYNYAAIAAAERLAGCNLLMGLENLMSLSASQFLGLLYAAMSKAQPKLTMDDVAELIRLDTMGMLQEALAEAYMNSLPAKKDTDNANPPGPVTPA